MAAQFKPSSSHAPDIQGTFTTLRAPEPLGLGRAERARFSPGVLGSQTLLRVDTPLCAARRLSSVRCHLQAEPTSTQKCPGPALQIGSPVRALLPSSGELIWGKQEKRSWGAPRCKGWKCAPGQGKGAGGLPGLGCASWSSWALVGLRSSFCKSHANPPAQVLYP